MASDFTKAVLRASTRRSVERGVRSDQLPDSYTGVALHADGCGDARQAAAAEKRPSPAMHVEEAPVPEIAPDEVLIATMASSINFNTVWSAIFEPMPTFASCGSPRCAGSGASATTSRSTWSAPTPPASCCGPARPFQVEARRSRRRASNDVALEDPEGHDDAILDPDQRVWGFESNYGGLGEVASRRPTS